MTSLRHQRIGLSEAQAFVLAHHRHHPPPVGHLFSLGAYRDADLVGVAIVGRPVARMRDDGLTAEISRLCVRSDLPSVTDRHGRSHANGTASFLLSRCARAAIALGYRRIGTYTLARESGVSLRAAGWSMIAAVKGRSWDTPSRRRTDRHPTEGKLLWELEHA